jgi:uncharacterized protein (TIGR02266 family)
MEAEKRKEARATTEIRVEYRTVGSFLSDYLVNISKGGMFIHTRNPLKVGAVVRLVFSLPGMPFPFDLTGEVKWTQTEPSDRSPLPGMGLAFVDMDTRIQRRIETFVKKHADAVTDADRGPNMQPKVSFRNLPASDPREDATHFQEPSRQPPKKDSGD